MSTDQRERVTRLAYLVQPRVSPAVALATDHHLLATVGTSRMPGALRVFTCPGDVLAAGRWHLLPAGADPVGAGFVRRRSGGRALPLGDGYLGMSLVLPHRSALVAAEPLALAPAQVPNRYVRGLMRALERLGLAPVYPGRDLVTVERRPIAAVSFDTDADGRLVLEMILAVERPLGEVARLVDRADSAGVIPLDLPALAAGTCLRDLIATVPTVEQLGEAVAAGFAEQFGVTIAPAGITADESRAIASRAAADTPAWNRARARRDDLPYAATTRGQLGAVTVFFALGRERTIEALMLAGDFIANAGAVAALEERLAGCPADPEILARVAEGVLAEPTHYLLGLGSAARALAGTIVGSVPQ